MTRREAEIAAAIAADLMEDLPQQPPKSETAAEHNRRLRAELARERWERRQAELPRERLQRAIDDVWERTLAAKQELAREDRQSCHRGRGDPDWDPAELSDPMGVWRRPR
jgi:hypothetical protein